MAPVKTGDRSDLIYSPARMENHVESSETNTVEMSWHNWTLYSFTFP